MRQEIEHISLEMKPKYSDKSIFQENTPVGLQDLTNLKLDHKMAEVVQKRFQLASFSVEEFQYRLNQLDLDPIIVKLMDKKEGPGWSLEFADESIYQYKCFLLANFMYPNRVFVPTHDIDLVWHQHVMDTEKYSKDCELLFSTSLQRFIARTVELLFGKFGIKCQAGLFFHHFPYFGMRGEQDEANLIAGYQETQAIFQEHFNISILPNNGGKCIKSCHWCSQIAWTERPRPIRN